MKTNPFLAIHKRRLQRMSPAEIIIEAKRRGYKVYPAPPHYERIGYRIGGSPAKSGPDLWMNDANVRLWKVQTRQLLPVMLTSGRMIYTTVER
jgi:hypothetical protein